MVRPSLFFGFAIALIAWVPRVQAQEPGTLDQLVWRECDSVSIDGEDEIRWQRLAEQGDIVPSFIRYIERKLQTPDEESGGIRVHQALERLSGFRDRRTVPLMIRLLRTPAGGAADRATSNLLHYGDASVIDEIRMAILETAAKPFSKEQHALLWSQISGCEPQPYPSELHYAMIPTLRELGSMANLHKELKAMAEFVCAKIESAEQKWDGEKYVRIPVSPANSPSSSATPRNTVAPIDTGLPASSKRRSDEETGSATLAWIASVLGLAVALSIIRTALRRYRRGS